ncbi:NAD-dependent epimerase/dehydratase family protein [Kaistia geumhonensis]|uniref:Nucleoside-diphosphate-sugar epimerase n=1 Tax=Kaistia geumhonensis TaxID=410839 RepID=A0ABU0M5P0_9HYPH|nr:NAD-dependent epimerase/dehydratase family protein [Kaistia geumhonensis]MCX5478498.1 NAD-dependent epimerase/dehydratase family protein [Kaistia geumhonensis]MDQ0516284.1 nucleoside-diphosphate-sugar epimerase [Kaistia geumhonensis]
MAEVLILGGTGTISSHTLAALVAGGHGCTILTRGDHGPPGVAGVATVTGDRRDEAALAAALATVRPDVVIDFACFRPEEARAIARIAHGRIRHYVFVSTVDVFGFPQPSLPIAEDAPPCAANTAYAEAKQACERIFAAACDSGRFPVTIVRPTYSLGPRFVISLFEHRADRVMARMRHGRAVAVPGDGGRLIHVSDAADTGRMIAALAGRVDARGARLTVGTAGSVMTHADYCRRLAHAVGAEPRLVFVPDAALAAEPAVADGLYPALTRFDLSFAIGGHPAFDGFAYRGGIDAGIAAYAARIEAQGAFASPPPEDFEDALAARFG